MFKISEESYERVDEIFEDTSVTAVKQTMISRNGRTLRGLPLQQSLTSLIRNVLI